MRAHSFAHSSVTITYVVSSIRPLPSARSIESKYHSFPYYLVMVVYFLPPLSMRGKNPPRSLAQKPLSPPCRRIQYLQTGYFADPAIFVRASVAFVAEF